MKLIVIEGTDGSGKGTQTKKLYERMTKEGYKVKQISFPDYESESSSLIKMYLKGEFGSKAEDVNAYTASTFYAVDRYASYRMKWQKNYSEGEIILADRYTTSNMIHQTVKINDEIEREKFLNWLEDFEYKKLQLPRPDSVIFLNMPIEIAKRLIIERKRVDIHEKDFDYLCRCYELYKNLAKKFNWLTINCNAGDKPRTIEEIHEEIFERLIEVIK